MESKWFAITIVGISLSGSLAIGLSNLGPPSTPQETIWEKKRRYTHEEKMAEIQRDTMPHDSILLILGNRYKLVKQ